MSHCKYSSSHFTDFKRPHRKHGHAVLVPVPSCCLQKAGSELCNTVENNMAYHQQPKHKAGLGFTINSRDFTFKHVVVASVLVTEAGMVVMKVAVRPYLSPDLVQPK